MKQTYLSGNSLDLQLWRLQRSSAIFVMVLVVIHLILQFIVFNSDAISFLEVSDRIKSGFILTIDVVLLISVSVHGYLGFRSILLDYINSSRHACFVTYTILLTIALTILYGLVALRAFI
jgi:succinate dehydrogenase / fumarate reductase membrane anchor subunit